MSASPEITVALIGAFATLLAGVLSALVTKYGVSFWKGTKKIKVRGELVFLKRCSGKRVSHAKSTSIRAQRVEDGVLSITGNTSTLEANYLLEYANNQVVTAKLRASGRYKSGTASLSYRISGSDSNQDWVGVIILNVPPWGEIDGYYLSPNKNNTKNIGLGHVKLVRR